ncbi:MAG TPA: hypothetical protein VGL82_11065 [Bryobacteraceae bacterium]|jgi:hypothetical protein
MKSIRNLILELAVFALAAGVQTPSKNIYVLTHIDSCSCRMDV